MSLIFHAISNLKTVFGCESRLCFSGQAYIFTAFGGLTCKEMLLSIKKTCIAFFWYPSKIYFRRRMQNHGVF